MSFGHGLLVFAALSAAPKDLSFTDLQGGTHQPLRVQGKAHVLLFLTHDCPIANSYAPEIVALQKAFAEQPVRFFLIHVDSDLTPDVARKHAAEFSLRGPILIDAQHQLVKATGVTIVPEAAVLTPDGKVPYRGRIDDLYQEVGKKRPAPTKHDLRDALKAVLAGKPVEPARTQAVGCSIPELR